MISETGEPRKRSLVLVVHPNSGDLGVIRTALEGEGFGVAVVSSTLDARERLKRGPFDVVVVGCCGDRPGLELLADLKTAAPDVPIVLLVCGTDAGIVAQAVRSGAFDYLRMPIQAPVLVDCVRRAVASAGSDTADAPGAVVVVEDDPLQLRIISTMLADAGHAVRAAGTLSEARAALDAGSVDLLMTDVGLGDGSGLELLADIQRLDRDLPVVMITAATDARTAIESLRAGAFEYIQKPIVRESVLDAVRRGLERRTLARRAQHVERQRVEYERRLEKLGEDLEQLALERTRDLRRMHQFTESILRSIESGILTVDLEQRVTSVNASARRILELPDAGVVGEPLESTSALEPFAQAVAWALESRAASPQGEVRIALPAGRAPLIVFGVNLLTEGEGGQAQGAVVHFADITDKRAFEDALIQADKFAALGQMASSMAHDINGPLTVILGFAEMLRPRLTADPVMLGQMDKVVSAARHCEAVIANLLKFSRNERYQLAPTDLGEVVKSVVALVEREMYHRSIKVEAAIPGDLPRCLGHAAELRQLLFNLLLNARDAMPGGGAIRVSIAPEDSKLRLRISDTGQGMSPDVLRDIFRPFFTTKPAGRGTGLGLSICAAIVSRHNGQIAVESTLGQGTTFTIHLPEAGAVDAKDQPKPPPAAPPARLRVLVVDDDEGIRHLCQVMIENMGSLPVTVPSAEAALEMLGAAAFDCVLADVNLPGMDGLAMCVQVRLRHPGLPVAIMSGSANLDRMLLRSRWGAFEVLRKPFSREALELILAAVSEQKSTGGPA